MNRARAIVGVLALLAWTLAGCLNPLAADEQAMDCCAGMDCSSMEGAHDCCRAMTPVPQGAIRTQAQPVVPPLALNALEVPSVHQVEPASELRFSAQGSLARAHAPPLQFFVLEHTFLI